MLFKVGDLAVYPAHGVGRIESIEEKEISGTCQLFYTIRIMDNGMTIMIPSCNIKSVGLRQIISKTKVKEVYSILKDKEVEIDNQTWNRRYREYMEKIKTGSVFEIAIVLRDLHILKHDKELSFGERKLLDMATNLLVKELAIAEDTNEDQVRLDLKGILTK
ncbi:MAG: CarD family transcriptional regulator [Deltaproteobacteria bacterium]|uniref:CarD family transcriptional regulator n=1 Tax=Candidatus Zymogenus saltonus TaxID=2844893 RepID=A0A9D8PNQ5_9DELT|nr:CarD family transcriptional regulator [Candidatus Zymogenus saltonus]